MDPRNPSRVKDLVQHIGCFKNLLMDRSAVGQRRGGIRISNNGHCSLVFIQAQIELHILYCG
jgi:hypothetical protein